jgi:hypothetical protein
MTSQWTFSYVVPNSYITTLKNVCSISFEVDITQSVSTPILDPGNESERLFDKISQNSTNGGKLTPSSDFGER